MKPNAFRVSDIAAGFCLAASIAPALLYYVVAAIQISAGHFFVGGALTGIIATDVPIWLRPSMYAFIPVFPAIVAYVVWTLCHRYAGMHPGASAALAFVLALISGFPALNAALFNAQEVPLAITSGVAMIVCVGLALLELRHRRQPTLSDEALTKD